LRIDWNSVTSADVSFILFFPFPIIRWSFSNYIVHQKASRKVFFWFSNEILFYIIDQRK
jgi:hypothetical protein